MTVDELIAAINAALDGCAGDGVIGAGRLTKEVDSPYRERYRVWKVETWR